MSSVSSAAALALCVVLGCSDDAPAELPDFPEDYRTSYQEVRGCRRSLEHDLAYIRVFASPDALAPYTDRQAPFPAGAVVLKEQYAENDRTCEGSIMQTTVMTKLEGGASPRTLDWRWQRVSSDLRVLEDETPHCAACHSACGTAPDGYDGTCTQP